MVKLVRTLLLIALVGVCAPSEETDDRYIPSIGSVGLAVDALIASSRQNFDNLKGDPWHPEAFADTGRQVWKTEFAIDKNFKASFIEKGIDWEKGADEITFHAWGMQGNEKWALRSFEAVSQGVSYGIKNRAGLAGKVEALKPKAPYIAQAKATISERPELLIVINTKPDDKGDWITDFKFIKYVK